MDQAKKEQTIKDLEKLPELEQNEIISIEESYIQELTEEYINSLDDPQELKNSIGCFKNLLTYIYKYYLKDYLAQYNKYDIQVLDNVFSVYIYLVRKYKKNNLPNILEFTELCNINHTELCNIKSGLVKSVSIVDIDVVQKWHNVCENALIDDNGIKSIFLLKSKYNYVEAANTQPIIHANNVLNVGSLPDIKDIMLTNNPNLMIDNKGK